MNGRKVASKAREICSEKMTKNGKEKGRDGSSGGGDRSRVDKLEKKGDLREGVSTMIGWSRSKDAAGRYKYSRWTR